MQPPAEAGGAQGFGDVAHALHDEEGTLMVVLEVHGTNHGKGKYFSIGNLGQLVALVTRVPEHIGNDAVNGYNPNVVQGVAPLHSVGFVITIVLEPSWTLN
jgi:hypothetical protein